MGTTRCSSSVALQSSSAVERADRFAFAGRQWRVSPTNGQIDQMHPAPLGLWSPECFHSRLYKFSSHSSPPLHWPLARPQQRRRDFLLGPTTTACVRAVLQAPCAWLNTQLGQFGNVCNNNFYPLCVHIIELSPFSLSSYLLAQVEEKVEKRRDETGEQTLNSERPKSTFRPAMTSL